MSGHPDQPNHMTLMITKGVLAFVGSADDTVDKQYLINQLASEFGVHSANEEMVAEQAELRQSLEDARAQTVELNHTVSLLAAEEKTMWETLEGTPFSTLLRLQLGAEPRKHFFTQLYPLFADHCLPPLHTSAEFISLSGMNRPAVEAGLVQLKQLLDPKDPDDAHLYLPGMLFFPYQELDMVEIKRYLSSPHIAPYPPAFIKLLLAQARPATHTSIANRAIIPTPIELVAVGRRPLLDTLTLEREMALKRSGYAQQPYVVLLRYNDRYYVLLFEPGPRWATLSAWQNDRAETLNLPAWESLASVLVTILYPGSSLPWQFIAITIAASTPIASGYTGYLSVFAASLLLSDPQQRSVLRTGDDGMPGSDTDMSVFATAAAGAQIQGLIDVGSRYVELLRKAGAGKLALRIAE